jgi:hypothetical protein
VDSESIQVTKFPNIPLREQSRFEPVDLSKILINEECIRFRLKDWSNVDFLYFPTFLIARFDYTDAPIANLQAYQDVKKYWMMKVEELRASKELTDA